MSTNFIEQGEVLNYTAANKAITSGDVVIIGNIAGVAKTDIAIGETGAIHITGVYSLPKANEAITQGVKVFWSNKNNNVTISKLENIPIGVAANNTISSESQVHVLLNIGL